MANPETRQGPEKGQETSTVLETVRTNLEQRLVDQMGAERVKELELSSTPEMQVVAKLEEIQGRKVILPDGSIDVDTYERTAIERIDGPKESRIAAWLALVETDIRIAQDLKDSSGGELPSGLSNNFTEVAVRGGTLVQREGGFQEVLTQRQIESDRTAGRAPEILQEIGGNVTVDAHVLPRLKDNDVELLKAAIGAKEELDPDDPEYTAYFRNTTLGKGKIQGNDLRRGDTPVIQDSRHNGQVFKTDIPGFILHINEDAMRRPEGKMAHGYYVFADRLKEAEKIAADQK